MDPEAPRLVDFHGTPYYMAPELLRLPENKDIDRKYTKTNQFYDSKVDIWALGCITYQMFALRTPYEDHSQQDTRRSLFTRVLESEISYEPFEGNQDLQKFLERCLEKDPEKRYTADQLLNDQWITSRTSDHRISWQQ